MPRFLITFALTLICSVSLGQKSTVLSSSLDHWVTGTGEAVTSGWKVEEDNTLLCEGKGSGILLSKQKYRDFSLTWEWKLTEKGNSGIKYRVRQYDGAWLGCEYQMLDDENYGTDPFSLNATASLYAIWEPSGDKHLNPGGEWNQSQIVLKGNRVRHYLNGELMVNGRIGSKDWKQRVAASKFKNRKDFSLNRDGLIMLTEHGNPTWFRNVVITELGPLSGARANR
ncbi:MAG: hypothetical protein CMJ82_11890 [Planctomycetaceae bacterium]|nr:hypothetical protein [Planctomycetaceae bacterium]|tara:strand:+ start:334 stop:1011 length:678 start_codon:yes stop_codon:yes gene_type:complete